VIEKAAYLPAGTLGFCASGKITSEEYRSASGFGQRIG
jgi:hypothetical protein